MKEELNLTFFCENTTIEKNDNLNLNENVRNDILDFYVIKKGFLLKKETIKTFSNEFMPYLINQFNLTDYLERRYNCNIHLKIFYFYPFKNILFLSLSHDFSQ